MTPQIAMEWSQKQISEWQGVKKRTLSRYNSNSKDCRSETSRWKAPALGKLKVNVDASVYTGSCSNSVGMILREHLGVFVQARNARCEGVSTVFEAEAWGVLEALKWVQVMQVRDVEIECDSMLTATALHKGIDYRLEVGFILKECISILRDRPDLSVSYVKKQANRAAHLLARVPCLVNSFNVFLSPPPSVLETLLYNSTLLQ